MSTVPPNTEAARDAAWDDLPRLLEAWAERSPGHAAIVAPGRAPLSYARLRQCVHDTVRTLNAAGLGRGDRVAVALPNGPEMAMAFLSVAVGAVCAPLNPAYREEEFDYYLSDVRAKALLVLAGTASPATAAARARGIPLLELAPAPGAEAGVFTLALNSEGGDGQVSDRTARPGFGRPEDVALVLHTSGTTARPKIVPMTQRNICASAFNIGVALELTPADRCLNVMPLFHSHGLNALYASVAAGATVICPPDFEADRFFDWLEECRPTWYTAAPTIHQTVLGLAASRAEIVRRCPLRFVRSSSSVLPPRVRTELECAFGAPVIDYYGMTEATSQITSNLLPPRARKAGSVGVAVGPEVAVVGESGDRLPPGGIGEVVIRGVNVISGYENNPAANESAFRNGWFHTGDQGYLDADGCLFLTGRLKEMINRGGEKIAPQEIDDALVDHPDVVRAVAFAVPHATLGEDVAAAVVLRDGASVTEKELREHAARSLAPFKVPRRIRVLDALPVGPTGKIPRIGLAEKLGMAAHSPPPGAEAVRVTPRTPVEMVLADIWCQILGLEAVDTRDDFFDLGGHSLLAFALVSEIERRFDKKIPLEALFDGASVERLARLLTEEGRDESQYPFVTLQSGGARPPFFFLDGDVLYGATFCLSIARHLGAQQPFYLLRPLGLDGRPLPPTAEAMAVQYVRTLRQFQPEGPYFLGGHCNGAVLAYEVARQLQAQGQKVGLLALIDPRVRDLSFGALDRSFQVLGGLAGLGHGEQTEWLWRLRHYQDRWPALRRLPLRQQFRVARAKVGAAVRRRRAPEAGAQRPAGAPESPAGFDREAYYSVIRAYRARRHGPYAGRVMLLWSSEPFARRPRDPAKGWGKVARDVEVRWLVGTHHTCITEHVVDLAEHLRGCLLDAQAAERGYRSGQRTGAGGGPVTTTGSGGCPAPG